MRRFCTMNPALWVAAAMGLAAGRAWPAPVDPGGPDWCGVREPDPPAALVPDGQGGGLPFNPYTHGPKRLILIRVDFDDLPGFPFSDTGGLTLLTNIHDYFEQVSRGSVEFLVPGGGGAALTPVLRMPLPAARYGTNNLISQLRADARAAATGAGYDLADYDFDMIWMGNVPGFAWAGLGFIGTPGAWLRNTDSAGVACHEIGHNLGLNHANVWDTSGASVIGPGRSLESADTFDTMGTGGAGREFNTRYKRLLHWLGDGEVANALSNGTYRIFAHDLPGPPGSARALTIPQLNGTNYWVEYRQAIADNPWIQHGVLVRWGFVGNQRTLLLDLTPGSPEGRDDSALLIGRTFSDPLSGIHLTLLNRGGAGPWVDLVVNRGPFPENLPPTLALTADATNVDAGSLVTFQAVALDDNGDALSHHWDFGDRQFASGQTSLSHHWDFAGVYRVRCTVSDMKGGQASASILVQVGQPSGARVSGRVLDENGLPVADVRVATAFYFHTLTDSDGRYVLTGLPNNNYFIQAALEGYALTPSGFTNPLTLAGADARDVDFLARRDGTGVDAVLVPAGSAWSYLDNGLDPGPDWMQPAFEDAWWPVGRAQLGYGDGDETTVTSFGIDPDDKPITTWFRHVFTVPDPGGLASLTLGLERDDGALVYLNGSEVFRSNLPLGRVTPLTEALETVGGSEEVTFFANDLSPALLVAGTNLLAVEVHQQDQESGDLSFDLFLTGTRRTNLTPGLSIAAPAQGARLLGPTNLLFRVNAWAGPNDPIARVDYYIGGDPVGSSSDVPFSLLWPGVAFGDYTLTTRAMTAGGIQLTSGPVRFSIGAVLVPSGAMWRYWDQGSDLGTNWRLPEFDDAGWPAGPAQLGYGDGDEMTTVGFGPDENNKPITTYFRAWFDLPPIAYPEELRLRLLRDDGAVVYVNGREVRRTNLPFLGTIGFDTPAQTTINGSDEALFEETWIPAAGLLEASNLVAVEVHQRSASSPDLGFDLELVVPGPDITEHPPLGIVWSGEVLQLNWPTNVTGFQLEESLTPGMDPPWITVPVSPFLIDGLYRVFIIPDGPVRFYRLRKP